MAVSARSFQNWRTAVAPGESNADLCRRTGIKRSTLGQQIVRGKVAEITVVRVARAYGKNPVEALSDFEEYSDLLGGPWRPAPAELISQVSYICILQMVLARATSSEAPQYPDLDKHPHRNAIRSWFEAVDPGDLRQRLSAATGVAPQNISAQLSAGRLAPELAVEAARIAGASLPGGLVATGLVTPGEAGWPQNGLQEALDALTDSELLFLARDRLDGVGKQLRKLENDVENDLALLENLG
ncbi:septum formation family protein [Arthrobacter zhaoxinii]|uniref:Septum formation family protein n=1 Tax=Arthrobacter zhaoxinii TaxID=2964616 RepID=A0ABY5YQ89_9MICC|nr:septum formation family protein [Arthrobacter zhaoxinii]